MDEILTGASVPAIAAAVYWIVNLIKYVTKNNEKVLTYTPIIAGLLGAIFGVIAFFFVPDIVPSDNLVVALVIGAGSGLTATGFNQIIKQIEKDTK